MPTSEPGADASGNALGLIAHARYACRHSGVCCSSDWEIPVEDALHARLAPAIGTGELQPRDGVGLIDRPGLPAGVRSVLGRRSGRCVFHTAGPCGCGLHAWGGADAKPIACRQFPWIAVHDPRGTFASLSHVCPAAQDRLLDPALLVLAPLPRGAATFDGLDVRRALPPALSPRRLLDWDALVCVGGAGARRVRAQRAPQDVLPRPDRAADACAALDGGARSARRAGSRRGRRTRRHQRPRGGPIRPSTRIVRASAPVGLAVPPPVAGVGAPAGARAPR